MTGKLVSDEAILANECNYFFATIAGSNDHRLFHPHVSPTQRWTRVHSMAVASAKKNMLANYQCALD